MKKMYCKKNLLICFLVVFLLITAYPPQQGFGASKANDLPLPFEIDPAEVRPLRELLNRDFQERLKKNLDKKASWKKLIADKKMAVGLVDLSDPHQVIFARVNGNEMMYAASLPKLAILLAAYHYIEKGTIAATPEVKKDLNLMIRKSDNKAATRMIERIGMDNIQSVLTLPRYEFYDTRWGGGLWVGKKYAKTGTRDPEPIKGLSHAATASQVCRFYYQLAMGKLVTPERSHQMLEILLNPGIEHKFVKTLHRIVPDALLFRKSGTWKTWHSDSVMVWGPTWRRYIAVALVDSPDGEKIIRELIPVLEEVLKAKTNPMSETKMDEKTLP